MFHRTKKALTSPATVRRSVSALVSCAVTASLLAIDASAQTAAPLFTSDDPLEITLTLPLRTLIRRRTRRTEYAGMLSYSEPGGASAELDVEVRTRGKSRLEMCNFPPLSLNLRRGQVAGTLFAGQNRIKLVTLCKTQDRYRQYLELEFLTYKIYEQFTDFGFRVRRVAMRYIDTDTDNELMEAPGFLIEHIDGVADRHGMEAVDLPKVDLADTDPNHLATLAMFQYMIGNTDWSGTAAAEDEDCCHNAAVLAPREGSGALIQVPYDFDQAGLIDTEYARPNQIIPIRSVRERYYRGYCRSNDYLQQTIDNFNAARSRIEALLQSERLNDEYREEALSYLAASYDLLNDPEKLQEEIVENCRG